MVKIELRNIQKYFVDNHVLKNVSLSVHEGETLVVIGRSGCGKSVMLKHMVGLFKPDRGSVFVDGEDITGLNEHQLFRIRKKFGFLFQGSALLDSLILQELLPWNPKLSFMMNQLPVWIQSWLIV